MVVAGIVCMVLILSFGRILNGVPHFVVPPGWPKPVYNFEHNPITGAGARLGRKLFFDPLLSADGSISCGSCHAQARCFAQDSRLGSGMRGQRGSRNATALVNLAWSNTFMWDGGVNNLEVQPLNPITNPAEMGSKLTDVVTRLNSMPRYRAMCYEAFNDSVVTAPRLLKALAQFTLLLQSYNAKYDRVMRHEPGQIFTKQEQRGYVLFKTYCATCHTEPLFTNNSFRNNGLPVTGATPDVGRMKVTGDAADSLLFKVPTLRNIEVSGPYMHDGRFATLDEVMMHYSAGIVHGPALSGELAGGMRLSARDRHDIVSFLRTLTDSVFLNDPQLGCGGD
ncbi:MAG: cytochrome c peroxidase [Bacteroidota bacterium]